MNVYDPGSETQRLNGIRAFIGEAATSRIADRIVELAEYHKAGQMNSLTFVRQVGQYLDFRNDLAAALKSVERTHGS